MSHTTPLQGSLFEGHLKSLARKYIFGGLFR